MQRKILAGDGCFGQAMWNFKWVPRVTSWNEFMAVFRAERDSHRRSRWLFLIRHAEFHKSESHTAAVAAGLVRPHTNLLPLTERGREQCEHLSIFLEREAICPDAAFISSSNRAVETALKSLHPHIMGDCRQEFESALVESGDQYSAEKALKPLITQWREGDDHVIFVIAHGERNGYILGNIFGIPTNLHYLTAIINLPVHTSIGVVELRERPDEDNLWLWDATPHLPDDLRTQN